MKDFASKQQKYFCNYGDAVESTFKKVRYGVSPCCPSDNFDLISMRYELAAWQTSGDYSLLSMIKRFIKWRPLIFENDPLTCITINIVDNAAESFKFDPAIAIWVINHSLPFTPNVTTTDLSGQEIQGTVQYITPSIINVVFSTPVSGWAYLS